MALLQLKKVLITDKIDAVCKSVFEKNGIEVDLKPGMPKDEILAGIKVSFSIKMCMNCP